MHSTKIQSGMRTGYLTTYKSLSGKTYHDVSPSRMQSIENVLYLIACDSSKHFAGNFHHSIKHALDEYADYWVSENIPF